MSFVGDFWQRKYRAESGKSWNLFYRRNGTSFFKDRHWTSREFPELLTVESILEIGCGVGNFILPLIEERQAAGSGLSLRAWACDFAPDAIELLKRDPRASGCTAFVADITETGCFPPECHGVQLVSSIFVLSALAPEQLPSAVANVVAVMGPHSKWIIRDYATGDAAQERFKRDRQLDKNLFVRQDGTLALYFDKDELVALLEQHGLRVASAEFIESKTTNVAKGIDQERRFLQITANKK